MSIIERSNWTNPNIDYLENAHIIEYDMKSGGLSVIKEFGLLDDKYIDKLENMDKQHRDIVMGKMQILIPGMAKKLVEGFTKARQMFAAANNIDERKILSIKKDALFMVDSDIKTVQVTPNILFRPKNQYSSYANLNGKELYYSELKPNLDLKGFSEDVKNLQQNYLFKDFRRLMKQREILAADTMFDVLQNYRKSYLERYLDINNYRNLDSGNFDMPGFSSDSADETMLETLNISHNYIYYVLPFITNILKSYR